MFAPDQATSPAGRTRAVMKILCAAQSQKMLARATLSIMAIN